MLDSFGATRIGELTMSHKFDVFLSYNSRNRVFVGQLYAELLKRGLQPWFDVKEMDAGDTVLEKIDEGIKGSRTIAVLFGAEGFGQYHKHEQYAAVTRAVTRGVRVIPVLLPGFADADDELPSFLAAKIRVEFARDASDEAALAQLIRSVLKDAPVKPPVPPIIGDPSVIAPPKPQKDTDRAVTELASTVKRFGTLTIFVGAGSGELRPYQIARQLLTDLHVIPPGYGALVPSMQVAGSYYEIGNGATSLETFVVDLVSKQTREQQPRLHSLIATLVEQLRTLAASRRGRQETEPALIVTTSIDLLLERALLRAGIPFTRIVQEWADAEITVNRYDDVKLQGGQLTISAENETRTFPLDDVDSLDEAIQSIGQTVISAKNSTSSTMRHPIRELAFKQFQTAGEPAGPILYKYHGSQDVPGSCALSTDQYFRLGDRRAIPEALIQMIGNSSTLFFACCGLDADMRHAYETLFSRAFANGRSGMPRYAIIRPPSEPEPDGFRQWEIDMWPRVTDAMREQMQLKVLQAKPEELLSDLIGKLST
jgi:hypothetical protein